MNRVKIELPSEFPFVAAIRVRITDLNYGGHVGNDSFLSLLHEARQQFLNYLGYAELELEGKGLIMADAAIEFKSELNYRDEVIIAVAAGNFTKIGFDLFYRMEIKRPDGNLLAGKAKTGMLCYDYDLKKVVRLPENALHKLQAGKPH
ncbi:MAG TPA: thioesterase family protein [Chitinophagaceae bacterium]